MLMIKSLGKKRKREVQECLLYFALVGQPGLAVRASCASWELSAALAPSCIHLQSPVYPGPPGFHFLLLLQWHKRSPCAPCAKASEHPVDLDLLVHPAIFLPSRPTSFSPCLLSVPPASFIPLQSLLFFMSSLKCQFLSWFLYYFCFVHSVKFQFEISSIPKLHVNF